MKILFEKIFRQKHSFYDIMAGALIGGGIGIAATACEEIVEKGPLVTLLRFAAVSALCLSGIFLVRIARILEKIERAVTVSMPDLIDIQRSEGKNPQEIEDALGTFRRRKEREVGKQVVPNFLGALVFFFLAVYLLALVIVSAIRSGLLGLDTCAARSAGVAKSKP